MVNFNIDVIILPIRRDCPGGEVRGYIPLPIDLTFFADFQKKTY